MTVEERAELRRIARKTWHFFETFVGEEDHWLPPDNYQEDAIGSGGRVAHRTSPTNKGMLLLSTLAAHDLGYLSLKTLLDRLEKTFNTFDRLEKHDGHFYNWYNTQTLRTLPPPYVSTVDSGNLLGCLVTLKQGMREKTREVYPNPSILNGLIDTLAVLVEDIRINRPAKAGDEYKSFDTNRSHLETALRLSSGDPAWKTPGQLPDDLFRWDDLLRSLSSGGVKLVALVRALPGVGPNVMDRWESYARRYASLATERLQELETFAPWASGLSAAEESGVREACQRSEGFDAAWKAIREKLGTPGPLVELAARVEPGSRGTGGHQGPGPGLGEA